MSDDPKPQQEPSMEEILASIRRIISEDETDEASAAPPEPEPEPTSEPEPDAFELTQEVRDDGSVIDLATGRTIVEAEAPELVEDEIPEPEPEPPAPEPPPVAPAPVAPPPRIDEGLVGPPAAAAATASFAALAQAVVGDRAARDLGVGGRTIEDLVKEVLRPMIKEWLDANLPELVERLVSREIDRMSRRAEDEVDG